MGMLLFTWFKHDKGVIPQYAELAGVSEITGENRVTGSRHCRDAAWVRCLANIHNENIR